MYLHIVGSEFTYHIREEILLLTGHSFFLGPTLRYDEHEDRVSFVLERFRLSRCRSRFLGVVRGPTYDRSRFVRTRVNAEARS